MSKSPEKKIATKESWKTLPLPEIRADLGFSESYSIVEFDFIKKGLIPEAMEDKWLIFLEESWLYFHRSWTGACIYGVRFQLSESSAVVVESWVSRDPNQYKETRIDYDHALLKFMIDAFLLGKKSTFPVPSNIPTGTPKGVYQHHLVGRAYHESTHPTGLPIPQTLGGKILRWFKR